LLEEAADKALPSQAIRDGLLGMCGIPDEDCDPAARHDEHEDDQQGAQEPGEGEM